MAIDFDGEGLLEGTGSAYERAHRLELLERLSEAGVSLEELRRAIDEDRLALLLVELRLSGDRKYTAAEIAERSGISLEYLSRQRRAIGLPAAPDDVPAFSDDDLQAAQRLKGFLDSGLSEQDLLDNSRVIGEAMARVAAATRDVVAPALMRAGDTELDLAVRYADAATELVPLVGGVLTHQFKAQLLEGIRRDVITGSQRRAGQIAGETEIAAAFADLVGFTRLGETLPTGDLGRLAGQLADLAGDVIEAPVQLVKTIGDAVMMVSEDPGALLDTSLELVKRAGEEGGGFPELKAGLAVGPAVSRAGDWYGHTINLAARLTQTARPGSVLVAEPVKEAVGEDRYQWSFAGERSLKGIEGGTKAFRVRALEPEA